MCKLHLKFILMKRCTISSTKGTVGNKMAFVIKYIKKLIIMHKDMMTLYVYHKMENFVDRKGESIIFYEILMQI